MKKLLLLLLICAAIQSVAQITGTLKNAQTQEGLAFASIISQNTGKGTISNADGLFRMACPVNYPDTLRISFIGFEMMQIPLVSCPTEPLEIALSPSFVEVPTVIIAGEKGTAPEREMKILKKWQEAKGNWDSKVYLSLTSEEGETPVEAVEACFNGSFYGNNILDLALKGGRLGVHSDPKFRFVNLNTTDVLLKFSLKPERNSPIKHPAVQRKKDWKADYIWDLLAQSTEDGDTLRHWILHPKFPTLSSCEIVFKDRKSVV